MKGLTCKNTYENHNGNDVTSFQLISAQSKSIFTEQQSDKAVTQQFLLIDLAIVESCLLGVTTAHPDYPCTYWLQTSAYARNRLLERQLTSQISLKIYVDQYQYSLYRNAVILSVHICNRPTVSPHSPSQQCSMVQKSPSTMTVVHAGS